MAVKLALPYLIEQVVERFALEGPWITPPVEAPPTPGVPVPNVFGWKKPEQQTLRGNRIIWVPGDDDSGDAGEYIPARGPGNNPRPLAGLGELFTVYVVGEDKSTPENELAQYNAARLLHDAWFRAIYLAAHGTFKLNKPRWYGDAKERRRGATLRILGVIEAPIPDEVFELVPDDAHAEIDTALHADFEDDTEEEVVDTTEDE